MDSNDFARWESTTPPDMVGDSIWKLPAYRLSRFLSLLVTDDCRVVLKHSRRRAEQLESSVDSIGANIVEGYGRLHGRERARFYEFALSSAREAKDWYVKTDRYFKPGIAAGRIMLLTRVVKILTKAIPEERAGASERRMLDAMARSRRKSASGDHEHAPDRHRKA